MTIGTVFLRVADLPNQVRFYQERLGLQVQRQEAEITYLGAGGRDLLALLPRPHYQRYPQAVGLYHFALLLPSRAELALALLHLLETRTPLQGASDHLVSEALYLSDPEGNGIELYADRPRQTWFQREQLQMGTRALDADGLLSSLDGQAMTWQGLPEGTQMGHIHLHVASIPSSQQFYSEILGMEVMMAMGSASFLAYERYHHHVGINTWGGRSLAPADTLGLEHYQLALGATQLQAVMRRLERSGQSVEALTDGYAVLDPNGIKLHLTLAKDDQ
jgi:catechol 2,3-dioxygenase